MAEENNVKKETRIDMPKKINKVEKKVAVSDKKSQLPEKPKKDKIGVRVKRFFKDYKSEIKKIVWPTKPQVIKNTGIVLVVLLIMAAIVGILDSVFYFLLQLLSKI